jgi:MerR family transcriptional regulator, redox-sensitive transcriptional activator SoxR
MKEYAIGYLAQRTGLAVSAIRHYESQGLIKPNRTTSGQRRFAR